MVVKFFILVSTTSSENLNYKKVKKSTMPDTAEEEAEILELELGKIATNYLAGSIIGAAVCRLLKLDSVINCRPSSTRWVHSRYVFLIFYF